MTEYEKMKIPELRASGMGYKAIANVLGLSRDAVRGFCRKYGLNGNAEVTGRKTWNSKLKTECCAFTVQSLLNLKATDESGSFAAMNAAGSGGNKMQIKLTGAATQQRN